MARFLSIGECMAEFGPPLDGGLRRLTFGGDTLNTALYMARLAGPGEVAYVTRLGDDPFSAEMLAAWGAEGLDCSLVEMAEGRTVGLYAISLDDRGERSFTYWRDQAPAKQLFSEGAVEERLAAIEAAELVYFSGITLAILDGDRSRRALIRALRQAKKRGAAVAFDPNHRPQLWPDVEQGRRWAAEACGAATILLTSEDEEARLGGDREGRLAEPLEVVLKSGPAPCRIRSDGQWSEVAQPSVLEPRDTTGAGDAFNAAYLLARQAGESPEAAALAGHRLSAAVIMQPGAIIAREAMPPDSYPPSSFPAT
jgi:2-dehydro-3-deoxygluconokinase